MPPDTEGRDLEDWAKFRISAWRVAQELAHKSLIEGKARNCKVTGGGFAWRWETEEQTQWRITERGPSTLEIFTTLLEAAAGAGMGVPGRSDVSPLAISVGRSATVRFYRCQRIVLFLVVTIYTERTHYCPFPYEFSTEVEAASSDWKCKDEPYRTETVGYRTMLFGGSDMPYDGLDAREAVKSAYPASAEIAPMDGRR